MTTLCWNTALTARPRCGSVWANRMETMIRCLHFGSGDVLTVTAEQAAAVPLAGGMPAIFGDDDRGEPIAGLKAVVMVSMHIRYSQ